ncbi:MAG: methylenetetrahydrofolate--tRNA-(uracil(54)-C(5))-methyltransferase (FADH(2)-oxidizing) TrmFO [Polyangiaceae bacterium]|nr:methylenetetrahydrofolate--tRNA-(uracil(54)-C(5))-methyltransferase (FADH(2)-oxidizing) TrmFO [Polyangiaceae bacterium]
MTNSELSFDVTIVGAGLAGCEAAYQLAERGFRVRLFEMKPAKRTPAQTTDHFAELVCSNSLRGAALANAVGLLKEELRRCGSLVMRNADLTAVPAGGALAVDREKFGAEMTAAMREHPRITVDNREVTEIPAERPVILATGPLTSDALAQSIAAAVGAPHLAYYDAIAPIVAADSIDQTKVWKQSRWGKGTGERDPARKMMAEDAEESGDEAYVNCPFDEAQYKAFVAALVAAEKMEARSFEDVRYFEGCLPCEVMAERGERTLAYGPMKPVGLVNPHTGRRPYAVVQLRPEDRAATAYNLVGFQTRMKYPEQARVFRMIPGLEQAEFLRFGSVHRNTFVDAPKVLGPGMELQAMPGVFVAGQVAGVEGYVESAAAGFLCAVMLSHRLAGKTIVAPPATTALGGILTHLGREQPKYQPSNITWAHIPPLEDPKQRKLVKRARYEAMAARALLDLEPWRVAAL